MGQVYGPPFPGPLNNKKYPKPLLKELARALDLPEDQIQLNAKELLAAVKKHIKDNPALMNHPQFQGISCYRTASAAPTKNSADKVAEDEVEQGKDGPKPPTGANKVLLKNNIKTDPPAQFARVGMKQTSKSVFGGTQIPTEAEDADDNCSSDAGDDLHLNDPRLFRASAVLAQDDLFNFGDDIEEIPAPVTPKKKNTATKYPDIVVNLLNHNNSQAGSEEIWLPDASRIDVKSMADDAGGQKVVVKLSDLLPLALNMNTPIKQSGGRILRPGLTEDASRINLGNVEGILAGRFSAQAQVSKINNYILRPRGDGTLVCDLFLDTSLTARNIPMSANPPAIKPSVVQTASRPLASAHPPPLVMKKPRDPAAFASFLRGLIDAPTQSWSKSSTAGDVYDRFKALTAAKDHFEKDLQWGRTKGGFMVPENNPKYAAFAGETFTRMDITDAMNITHSSANSDKNQFDPAILKACPDIAQWVTEGKESAMDGKFRAMSLKSFREYIKERTSRRSAKLVLSKEKVVDGKGKKQAQPDEQYYRRKKNKSSREYDDDDDDIASQYDDDYDDDD